MKKVRNQRRGAADRAVMTAPREIVPGRDYMITRCCTQQSYLLKPEAQVTETYLYCLAEAAERFRVTVYAFTAMSNHHHMVVRDNEGNLPEFLAHFHKLVAKVLNAHWRRRENLWSNEQVHILHLVTSQDVFDKIIYVLANPIADHLVERVKHWKGASS